jgi:hypothetical protein
MTNAVVSAVSAPKPTPGQKRYERNLVKNLGIEEDLWTCRKEILLTKRGAWLPQDLRLFLVTIHPGCESKALAKHCHLMNFTAVSCLARAWKFL